MLTINSIFSEENKKRVESKYGQIGFSYDQSSGTQDSAKTEQENDNTDQPNQDQNDEAYVPHSRFYIPPDMEIVGSHAYSFHLFNWISFIFNSLLNS